MVAFAISLFFLLPYSYIEQENVFRYLFRNKNLISRIRAEKQVKPWQTMLTEKKQTTHR